MKTTKKLQRLHLDKNTTRYRKMLGGTDTQSATTPKSGFSTKKIFGNIGKSISKRLGYNTTQPLNRQNRFPKTSKVFRGIGRKFGLYKKTPKERLIGAVDELVTEIKKFKDKTRNYAQYGISDEEEAKLKKSITSTFAGIPVPSVSKGPTLAEIKVPVPNVSKAPTLAEIIIPNGAKSGQRIKTTVNGKTFNLTVPYGAKPGEIIRFQVKN